MADIALTPTVKMVMEQIRQQLEADDTKFQKILGMSLGLQMEDKVSDNEEFNVFLEKILLVRFMKGKDSPEKNAIAAAIKADCSGL